MRQDPEELVSHAGHGDADGWWQGLFPLEECLRIFGWNVWSWLSTETDTIQNFQTLRCQDVLTFQTLRILKMSWFVCWSSEVLAVPVGSSGSTDCLRSGRRIGGVGFSWKHISLESKTSSLWWSLTLDFRVSPFRVQSKLQELHTQGIAEVWLSELGCVARHHTSRPCKGRRWQEGHGFCGSQSHGNTVFNMINMSKCSIVHHLFACSADTGIIIQELAGWTLSLQV